MWLISKESSQYPNLNVSARLIFQKRLSQRRKVPPPHGNSDSNDFDHEEDIGEAAQSETCPPRLTIPAIMDQIQHINLNLANLHMIVDDHVVGYKANFKEMHGQLNDLHTFLSISLLHLDYMRFSFHLDLFLLLWFPFMF